MGDGEWGGGKYLLHVQKGEACLVKRWPGKGLMQAARDGTKNAHARSMHKKGDRSDGKKKRRGGDFLIGFETTEKHA